MGSIYTDRRFIRRNKQVEQSIHKRVCTYLRQEYPHAIFRTDGGGLKLTKNQAIQYASMQSGNGWPDLFIPYASKGYYGLFLELKKDGTAIYLKRDNSRLVANLHIQNQAATLKQLNSLGYLARFAVGYDAAIQIINWYFDRPETLELF